jgi:4-amino-4-deoxy-L-arabinose transferase-like glycosyltransferase
VNQNLSEQFVEWIQRAARGWQGLLVLLGVCLVAYAPGLGSIPVVDRDEARFAQASRQMFESVALDERDDALHGGGLVEPRLGSISRLSKPPLTYWVQASSAAVITRGEPMRDSIFAYRVPSAIAATLTVLLVWRFGASLFDPTTGFVAGAVLAASPLMIWEAHQARADHLLLLTTSSAMWALWEIRSSRRASVWRTVWLFGSLALGMLTKGPVTPMIVILAAVVLCVVGRDWRWLARTRPLIGLAVLAALLMPWVILVVMRVGLEQAIAIAHFETVGRTTETREGHWGPPGYHLFLLMFLLWPGCLLTLLAFGRTWRLAVRWPPPPSPGLAARVRSMRQRWSQRVLGRDAELFIVAWVVPSWLVFEFVATKLPHYTLPMYPALALISARAVVDATRGQLDRFSAEQSATGLNIWFALGVVVCVAVPIGLSMLGAGALGVVAGLFAAVVALVLLLKARSLACDGLLLQGQALAMAAMFVSWSIALGVILPRAEVLWVHKRLAAVLPTDRPVACYDTFEDSFAFMTRGTIERTSEPEDWLRAHPRGVLVVPRSFSAGELDLQRLDTVAGFNYAQSRFVLIDLVERRR